MLYPIENKVNNSKCITAVIGSLGYITISNHPLPGLVHIFVYNDSDPIFESIVQVLHLCWW